MLHLPSLPKSLPLALAALLLAAACGQPAAAHRVHPAPASGAAVHAPTVTKLLVVMEENHSLQQMERDMPYTFGLAKQYGYASYYFALTHPSLPNYVGLVAGQTYGVSDAKTPATQPLHGQTVFGQALAHGDTAAVYAESMPAPCATTSSGAYAVRHNPWTYFVSERSQCLSHDLPMTAFAPAVQAGQLPQVGMVVPNICHDGHNCPLAQADAWFEKLMKTVFAGPDWRSGHLAVVLTADEDDHYRDNNVLTVVLHPSQRHHVVDKRLDHYSLTRLWEEVARLPYLGRAASAPSLAKAFGLPVA